MEENNKQKEETDVETQETVVTTENNIQVKNEVEVNNSEADKSANESEYESVDESEGKDDERRKSGSRNSENDDGEHSGSETDDSVILEREEGDGQESVPAKKVDDDEDKKNPQYIPKRGTFYEHDDRTAEDVDNTEATEAEKENKKKVWQDKKERWSHDKYNDNDQAPKSRAELIAIYGYDIRNEDGPPRARRRRRYGRGPNKYTRNWEDEDAYSKPPVTRPKKPLRRPKSNQDEFSGSGDNRDNQIYNENVDTPRSPVRREPIYEERVGPSKAEPVARTPNNTAPQRQENGNDAPPSAERQSQPRPPQRVGTGRIVKPAKEIKDSDYRGFTKTRQFKSSKGGQKILPKKSPSVNEDGDYVQSQNFTNKNNSVQNLENEMGRMSVQEAAYKNGAKQHGGPRQGSVPPRLQAEQKSSKRYSSIRQRSLPETAAPPFGQHAPGYYPNEYNQPAQQPPPQQQAMMPQIPPPPIPAIPQQVHTVSATPILQAPPQYAAPFPQAPPAYLQPNVAPPPFIPQQTPPIINYVQSQAQFAQPAYQGFQQPFPPVPVNQPSELYQPQGGITYYSTDQQQVTQRAAPQKRPKAAIPIVPPPPEPRGRGRGLAQREPSPSTGDDTAAESKPFESTQFEDAAVTAE